MSRESGGLSPHAAKNLAYWERESDAYQERHGPQLASKDGLAWGVWQVPEAELDVLGEVAGLDILELGCGAAQWSISLAKLGARPVGLDFSSRQLEHARRAMSAAGVDFPLVGASAEDVPLDDETFDVVFCDHGAFNFADPRKLMPECSRLLRPGGLLAFNKVSPLLDLVWDLERDAVAEGLLNDYFTLDRFEDSETVDFQLPYGEWIRLFRANGLDVEDLIELQAPENAESSYDLIGADWARRWPAENIWKARKRG
jgi:SAM-dependent methyltransferase